MPVNIFCSYDHRDERRVMECRAVMRRLIDTEKVVFFTDHDIAPGKTWKNELDRRLEAFDMVLLLVSANSLESKFCAYERQRARETGKIVIPVLLADCEWEQDPIAELQAIPRVPIERAESQVLAWAEVVEGIERVIEDRFRNADGNDDGAKSGLASAFIEAFPPGFLIEHAIDRNTLRAAMHPLKLPPVFYHWRVGESSEMHWIDFSHLQVLRAVSDLGFRIELLVNDAEANDLRLVHANTQRIVDSVWSSAKGQRPKLVWSSRLQEELPDVMAFMTKYGFDGGSFQRVRKLIGVGPDVDTLFDMWLYLAMFHARNVGHCIFYVRDKSGVEEQRRQEIADYLLKAFRKVVPWFIYRPTYGATTGLGKSAEPGRRLFIDAPDERGKPTYKAVLQWLVEEKNEQAVADLAHYLTLGKFTGSDPESSVDASFLLDRAETLSPPPLLRPRLESPDCPGQIRRGALAIVSAMLEWNERYFGHPLIDQQVHSPRTSGRSRPIPDA